MRIVAKTDDNQKQVVRLLRRIPGVSVAVTSSMGNGFPDLVIGYKANNYLIELKDGNKPASRQKLTPAEEKFKENWKGQYDVCKSFEEICLILKIK